MNNKTIKKLLVLIGLLFLTVACAVGLSFCIGVGRSAASNENNVETIADEAIPLAGPQTVSTVQSVSEEIAPVATEQPTPTPTPTAAPTARPAAPVAAPKEDPTPAPASPAPSAAPEEESPTLAPATPTPTPTATPEPTPKSTTATRMLENANALLTKYYACTSADEKRELLGITNSNFSNDSFRAKLLADLGGSWEQLEDEVVDATQYQQDKTLYVQVYMSGLSSEYVPVVYTTQNSDLSGNQWATNLVYDDDNAAWMEYTQKHPYNDSRVPFGMTSLYNNEDGYDELKDVMATSPVWEEVVVDEGATTPDPSGAEG